MLQGFVYYTLQVTRLVSKRTGVSVFLLIAQLSLCSPDGPDGRVRAICCGPKLGLKIGQKIRGSFEDGRIFFENGEVLRSTGSKE